MSAGISVGANPATQDEAAARDHSARLRCFAIIAGLSAALAFIVVGLAFRLELYGDGSLFSYAVAAEDPWAFHWHNISGRIFVYLYAYLPAETFVHLTRSANGGIAVYGFLFFGAPLFGLGLTWLADRSPHRLIFAFACASTAVLCPLTFGAPTEMWVAHALFWPALALCHDAPRSLFGLLAVQLVLLALAFTHEGALVLGFAILVTMALRGFDDPAFLRAAGCAVVVVLVWFVVKTVLPPDDYTAGVMHTAAFDFIDVTELARSPLFVLLVAALAAYAVLFMVLRRLNPAYAMIGALSVVALGLAVYWLRFDHALHTDHRYYLRTALLFAIPTLGGLAAAYALRAEHRLKWPLPLLPRLLSVLAGPPMLRALTGALALVMLLHGVETAKFIVFWNDYKADVRALATGTVSDPALGDPRFVSSDRIPSDANRLSWRSTTPFLSVLLAPGLVPQRLVVNPRAAYFWQSCQTATASEAADRVIPIAARRLLRIYACLHRP
ncbi:MAG TPA: hypothetical protein VFB45_17480 [Pseudolabrys sp.]|nr:hypothetical protein [Pseudolabrys sp.]